MPIQKVTSGIIADGAIVATDIADGTVTGPKLGANSVSSNNIIASVTLTTPIVSGNLNLDTAGTTGIRVPAANTIAFHTAGTEDIRINATGNVGIGTSSPTDKLSVVGNVRIENAGYFSIYNADNTTFSQIRDSGGAYVSQMEFYTAGVERMRVTNGGELYVGTTTGTIDQSNFGFVVAGGELSISRNVGASSPSFNAYGTQGLARVMGDGDLENTNARYTGISDIKFKQNIIDATSQWDDIKAIKVRKYELIANPDRQHIGCVAQELEEVCPGLVIEREDDKGETYKSVAYSILYMKAVKALQEAMERIEKLETKLDAAEQKITELENANK